MPNSAYDVAILGGGLAGLTLALQLTRARPATSILVVEQRAGMAPEAAHKVGESTVELSAHYFAEVLGLRDHLEARQLPKAGLRYFFPAGGNHDIAARVEFGGTALPPVPSYQLDRGRFENELADRCRRAGVQIVDGTRVHDIELADPLHTITLSREGVRSSAAARWVIDATGPRGLLKRKLGLRKEVAHTINSSWFRLAGGLDLEAWSDDEEWLARMDAPGIRKLSTNHLMGEGYWVWLIPLASGPISIGIVADPRFHPYEEFNTLDRALRWLERHEPQLAAALAGRRDQIEDFLKYKNFAHSAKRVFSAQRWALSGVAGVFADPFYSPGSDFIAEGNTMITELVLREFAGEDIAQLSAALNSAYLSRFELLVAGVYNDHYQLFGNAEVMTAKLIWESAVYWGYVALPFYNGRLTDRGFAAATRQELGRVYTLSHRMEDLFRDWHALGSHEWSPRFITNHGFEAFRQIQRELHADFDAAGLVDRYRENRRLLEAIAVVLFHRAAERLGERLADDQPINPRAISLHRERWEGDGLFDGSGLSLAEAAARVAGIETMLLDERAGVN